MSAVEWGAEAVAQPLPSAELKRNSRLTLESGKISAGHGTLRVPRNPVTRADDDPYDDAYIEFTGKVWAASSAEALAVVAAILAGNIRPDGMLNAEIWPL